MIEGVSGLRGKKACWTQLMIAEIHTDSGQVFALPEKFLLSLYF